MIYLGIDPGKHGGIAGLDEAGRVVRCAKMPLTEADLLLELIAYEGFAQACRAVLERVWSSPMMGVVSAWTFGKGYGSLLMGLTATAIPFAEVTPQTWQTGMACRTGGDKNVSKRRAQALFPQMTITHANADCLLIASYCRQIHRRPKVRG